MKKPNRFYRFAFAVVRVICALLYPSRYHGRENIPEGAAVICANHSNYIDPVLLALSFGNRNEIHYMAKKELFAIPVLGAIIRGLGAFPVDRGGSDVGSIRAAMRYLKDGEKIGIFPEGTRVSEDEAADAKTGAIRLAAKMKAPIVPVFIPRRKAVFRRVDIVIGEPYYITDAHHGEHGGLSQELMERISALRGGAG